MRAIVITAPGGPEVLELRERPDPVPGPGQLRVAVRAAGLNRADLLQRRGGYPAPAGAPADIPGLEFAGVVDAVGDGVTAWSPGARVMGVVAGGAYAERVVLDEGEALPIPAGLDFAAAAAVPEAFTTAHDALFTRAALGAGERLLVHAAGSGVGTAAIQLAAAAGATVHGTSRSAWKLERARALGLQAGIVLPAADPAADFAADFAAEVRARTGAGIDVVLDLVGGTYLAGSLRALEPLGRLVLVGLVAGARAEVDLGLLLRQRLTVVGTVLRSRPLEQKIAAARLVRRDVLPLLESGRVRPLVDRVFPATHAADAHRLMERNENYGKIVLSWE
jgi:NADPH:quinone reductase